MHLKNAILLGILSTMVFIPAAAAQNSVQPETVRSVYACKIIDQPQERLACYDEAVNRMEFAEKSGEIVTVSKEEVENVKRDAFGFNIPSLPRLSGLLRGSDKEKSTETSAEKPGKLGIDDVDSVELTIKNTTTFGYKKTRFFLTNGQVWEQVGSDEIRIPRVRDGIPNTVSIRTASLGSYLMQINDRGRAVRVKRIR